jgi:tRNA-specific 2-thiouridylase
MRLGSPGDEVDRALLDEAPAGGGKAADRAPGERAASRQGCCSVGDAADARLVAAELGVPLYVCNFRKDFGRIIDYFVDEYAAGRTPNPCVRCNDWLKFGKLHEYARQIGATHVASGHYARIDCSEPEAKLLRARDVAKDQSYVLFGIPRAQLGSTLLPVGEFADKGAVRTEAQRLGLPVFDKPDSYEICFVPHNDYAAFVEQRRPELRREGRIIDLAGREIGRHQGQHHFTVGQRRGTGVALGQAAYVVSRSPAANTVTLGMVEDLMTAGCEVGEANWLVDPSAFDDWRPALAQYRAHGAAAACRVRRLRDASGPTASGRLGRFEVRVAEAQRAVSPGQALVVYMQREGASVLGGGWIVSASV